MERVSPGVGVHSEAAPRVAVVVIRYFDAGAGVAEVLEEHLSDLLDRLEVDRNVRYYIGEDNVLPQVQSCSLMVTEYRVRDQRGAVGILGPMRMDYAYNTVALDLVADLLRSYSS